MNNKEVITHIGVLGMHWGRHKQKEAAYRDKLTAIGKNKSLKGTSDAKRFNYRNQNVAARVVNTAVGAAAQMFIGDILTDKVSGYAYMSKSELRARLTKIAQTTAYMLVTKDVLAKSASKRYMDSGRRVDGIKKRLLTKEDAIETGIKTAVAILPIAKWMLMRKVGSVRRDRAQNEARFKKWGANILTEKVSNFVDPISVTIK